MKSIKYNILALFTLFILFSCNDVVEIDKYRNREHRPSNGVPKVDRVVFTNDLDFEIDGAEFEQMIRLEGENLGNVEYIRFNDVEVDMDEVFARYEMIVVPVPRINPVVITDELYFSTPNGSVSIPFVVSVPEIKLTGLKNEFALPGDTTVILGDNFDLYDLTTETAIIKLGDEYVNVFDATRTTITVQIPPNAQPDTKMIITGGGLTTPIEVPYMHPGISQIFNFNDWPGYGGFTHASEFPGAPTNFLCDGTLEGQPEPLVPGSKYIRFNYEISNGWMVFWAGYIKVPEEMIYHLSEYDLRFEIRTDKDYPLGTSCLFGLGEYQWNPAESGLPLNTNGGWETVRVSADTEKLLPASEDIIPGGNTAFKIAFTPTTTMKYDVSMCNFRFVRK